MCELTIETPRLLLREFEERDVASVFEYASDPEVYRYRDSVPHVSEDQTAEQVRQFTAAGRERPRVMFMLALCLKENSRVIGECFLRREGEGADEAFIGYSLHPEYWGQGLMTEAATALLAFGFGPLGCRRIVSGSDVQNQASWRVLEKIGMRRDRQIREEKRKGWRESYHYSVQAQEWRNRHPEPGNESEARISYHCDEGMERRSV